jgi:DNA-binding CsgD family transcriptional regulator
MKICAFTEDELSMFRQRCNFTDLEMDCFNLKAKNKTNYQISMELNICDSTVSMTMKSVRAKITSVLEQRAKEKPKNERIANEIHPTLAYLLDFVTKFLENTPLIPESHTTKEWAELPDKVSIKDKLYVVLDFRTDDNSPSVPRMKYGDGVTMVSELPFCTAAITDNDVKLWDLQTQISQKVQ